MDEAAKAVSKAGYGSDCLKVLVAPEFFFHGVRGAYAVEKISDIVEALKKHVSKRGGRAYPSGVASLPGEPPGV